MEGLYSSKSSLASLLSLLWVSRSLALIDKLKAAKHLMIKTKDFKSFNKLKKLKAKDYWCKLTHFPGD